MLPGEGGGFWGPLPWDSQPAREAQAAAPWGAGTKPLAPGHSGAFQKDLYPRPALSQWWQEKDAVPRMASVCS
jgi:hypothetical protein